MWQPDDQRNDPYGWITNQAGHAAIVGMPASLALIGLGVDIVAAPIVVALVYALAWEWAQGHVIADWRDSLMDAANVMAGASIISGAFSGYWTAAACVVMWGCILALGWWQRT